MRLVEQFIERAKEADAWADAAPNAFIEWQWREIASAYRSLAQVRLLSLKSEPPSDRPLPSPTSEAPPRK
jgi:hypothetical protein